MHSFFQTSLEYLKGVGPNKALLIQQELQLTTFDDLIHYYPFRYEDRTRLHKVEDLQSDLTYVQLVGTISHIKTSSTGKKRLSARLRDDTGEITLVWFQGLQWILKRLEEGAVYTVFGKVNVYGQQISLVHPEIEAFNPDNTKSLSLLPVYHTTERLKSRYLDSRAIARLQRTLLEKAHRHVVETLPDYLLKRYQLVDRRTALINIHFPKNNALLQQTRSRLKFEELFYIQLQLLEMKQIRLEKQLGSVLADTQRLNEFYHIYLPFELTGAQKGVVKEIYQDLRSGSQMNRLVQGDVGSGKTMVAFLSMLIAIGSGTQVAMMAPTEILAEQHYQGLRTFAEPMGITIALLTGSTKKRARNEMHTALQTGTLQILVGTHSLLSDTVGFKNLGLAVIDEQHRFGVAQRAQLWNKGQGVFPHVLVMTATPIPRTLAMTLYGDLDISVMDEMPAGRKPIKTVHYYDAQRLKMFRLLKEQVAAGSQVYIVYPLIEESEKLDYKNLMDGYESICRAFPEVPVSIVHGQMYTTDKDYEMQRFVKGETKIMVATTVIEVGVNVPNATVMVIESAERFGLAQLHQLRGRVGRGSTQSYCILMTGSKLGAPSRERMQAMVRTNNGFELADLDLKLRGPGDLMGVQQSGALDLKIADLGQDGKILQAAREAAQHIMQQDPTLDDPQHRPIRVQREHIRSHTVDWSSVS
ncbi:MAG: ATP-dependent DNA helicase RecG [Roseivirga sp.]